MIFLDRTTAADTNMTTTTTITARSSTKVADCKKGLGEDEVEGEEVADDEGVGDVDGEDEGEAVDNDEGVGDVEGEDEVWVASTVPLMSVWVMGSDVPPGA